MSITLDRPETAPVEVAPSKTGLNVDLFYRVMSNILTDPDSWDQSYWGRQAACGTTYCFAGWSMVLGGQGDQLVWNDADISTSALTVDDFVRGDKIFVETAAAQLLGLDDGQANWLFLETEGRGAEGIDNLWEMLEDITNGEITEEGYQRWLAA